MDKPQFCPNKECAYHKPGSQPAKWYQNVGYHHTKAHGAVKRYACNECHKTFSDQTFSVHYFTKKVVDLKDLMKRHASGESTRAIGRNINASTGTVQNRLERLGRQGIAASEAIRENTELEENLTADGFESFVASQYFPDNFNILVGTDSQYVYGFTHVILRRKGRMTEAQKNMREVLYRTESFSPNLKERFTQLADHAARIIRTRGDIMTTLYTDEKKEYVTALASSREMAKLVAEGRCKHVRVSGKKPRTRANPLFAVNYMDREIRKDLANHRRETVCFSRNTNDSCFRMMVYCVYHNNVKTHRITNDGSNDETHADIAGIPRAVVEREMDDFFMRRRFLSHLRLPRFYEQLWRRELHTPLAVSPEYVPAYALQ
jgi:transposase-like protein